MEHYIKEIKIDKLRHLSNIVISLNSDQRQHLILTGKNGSGKTSLLVALQNYLKAINERRLNDVIERYLPIVSGIEKRLNMAETEAEKDEIIRNSDYALGQVKRYADGIRVFNRKTEIIRS